MGCRHSHHEPPSTGTHARRDRDPDPEDDLVGNRVMYALHRRAGINESRRGCSNREAGRGRGCPRRATPRNCKPPTSHHHPTTDTRRCHPVPSVGDSSMQQLPSRVHRAAEEAARAASSVDLTSRELHLTSRSPSSAWPGIYLPTVLYCTVLYADRYLQYRVALPPPRNGAVSSGGLPPPLPQRTITISTTDAALHATTGPVSPNDLGAGRTLWERLGRAGSPVAYLVGIRQAAGAADFCSLWRGPKR